MVASSARTRPNGYRFALNPIQFMATDDGWLDPAKGPQKQDLYKVVRRAGFRGIHAQVPADWSVVQYRAAIGEEGLLPAPGYFSMPIPEQGVPAAEMLEQLRTAVAQQADLGLTEMFLATRMLKGAPRVVTPAVGAAQDAGRLAMVVDLIGQAASVMNRAGVRSLLHPHVGTWIETEKEARQVLDGVPAGILGFGPDTGHLSWAGADVIGLLSDYRDRVGAVHIKDMRGAVRDAAIREGLSYTDTVRKGLWAEPGLGSLDLQGMLAALGPGFDGWLIAEVDFPTMDPGESARISAEWLAALARPASRA